MPFSFLHLTIAVGLTLMNLAFIRYGGILAISLLILVPMPLMLLGLMNGLLPASLGMSLVALLLSVFLPKSTLVYVFGFALPSIVLILLSLTGSIGRLAYHFPLFMAATAIGFVLFTYGLDLTAFNAQLSLDLDRVFTTPMGEDYVSFKSFLLTAIPPTTLFFWTVTLIISFFLASRLLKRIVKAPLPDLTLLKLPPLASPLLALTFLFSYFLPSLFLNFVIAALSLSFILQALAVLHHVTRGKSWRLPFLIVFYLTSLTVFSGVSQFALILLGLADVIFNFRKLKD